MKRKNKKLDQVYLDIANQEMEVTEEDLKNFEIFVRKHFPKSLRKTGKRKWKSFFWILFMLTMSLVIYSLGLYKIYYENEGFKEVWSIFLLGSLLAIPGFFYGFILLMIFLEIPGFDFEMIPNSSD